MTTTLETQLQAARAAREAEQRRHRLIVELAAEQRELVRLQALGQRLGYGQPLQMAAPPQTGRVASLPAQVAPATYEVRHKAAVQQARRNYQEHYARVHRDFDALVAAKVKAGASRYQALIAVSREQPVLWLDVRNLRPI